MNQAWILCFYRSFWEIGANFKKLNSAIWIRSNVSITWWVCDSEALSVHSRSWTAFRLLEKQQQLWLCVAWKMMGIRLRESKVHCSFCMENFKSNTTWISLSSLYSITTKVSHTTPDAAATVDVSAQLIMIIVSNDALWTAHETRYGGLYSKMQSHQLLNWCGNDFR